MDSLSILVALMSLVALTVGDSTLRQVGPRSYTDTLLNGMRRLGTKGRRSPAVISSVAVANDIYNECNAFCPLGTVCTIEFGVQRCVAAGPVVASVGDLGYDQPIVQLATDYSSPIRGDLVVGGAPGLTRLGRGVGSKGVLLASGGAGYGDRFGLAGCGSIPLTCRANQLRRWDANAALKYTFDYTLNECVQVTVCSSCALLNNVDDNLFDSLFSCRRTCL